MTTSTIHPLAALNTNRCLTMIDAIEAIDDALHARTDDTLDDALNTIRDSIRLLRDLDLEGTPARLASIALHLDRNR